MTTDAHNTEDTNQYKLNPKDEEHTWRRGTAAFLEAQRSDLRTQIAALYDTLRRSIDNTDDKAQTANDTLERLVNAKAEAERSMNATRFEASLDAAAKVERTLNVVTRALKESAKELADGLEARSNIRFNNIENKLNETSSWSKIEVQAVESRSLTHNSALKDMMQANDLKADERLSSVKSLIDLRAQLSEQAIAKAAEASDRRFDGVNEFRQTLSDQATHFVTRDVMDTNIKQAAEQIRQLGDRVAENVTMLAGLSAKVYIGGAVLALGMTFLQIVFNYIHPSITPDKAAASTAAPTALYYNQSQVPIPVPNGLQLPQQPQPSGR